MKYLWYGAAIAIACLAGCKKIDNALLGGSHDNQADVEQQINAMAEEGRQQP